MLRIYLVEDSEDISNLLQLAFNNSTEVKCVGAANNAEDAIETILASPPDIIILDIHLPGMQGNEAVKILRQKGCTTPIMMFTVFDDDQHLFDSLKNGANSYMLKNTPVDKLILCIKELHDGGAPMSPRIAKRVIESFANIKTNSLSASILEVLTDIEKQIIEKLSMGLLYKEISNDLNFTLGTIKQYIHGIYKKLEVNNRTEAVNKAYGK